MFRHNHVHILYVDTFKVQPALRWNFQLDMSENYLF